GNIFSFVELYQLTKKEGMTQQEVIDALKIVEEIPNLQAERQYIEDCIDDDEPKIFELKREREWLDCELKFLREHVEFTQEKTDLSEEELRRLAIPLTCNKWESK